ncbi:helix-turn-helix domain-containing protein [Acuticoccus sp. MNP-M23]|uniref:helix-turn-helix domain-containing protein n=1 Tax=Acuticoccus sp. MNP-M23 TaxID=3072793 RepID=UPI0028153E50|nr:helix-turn-helix domain-containing protein [Acuticoccus sp. MNP-M23]WMS41848.1 helix-turn-helix domain-containing protein [Acuticoccus sp. MNP-M23]
MIETAGPRTDCVPLPGIPINDATLPIEDQRDAFRDFYGAFYGTDFIGGSRDFAAHGHAWQLAGMTAGWSRLSGVRLRYDPRRDAIQSGCLFLRFAVSGSSVGTFGGARHSLTPGQISLESRDVGFHNIYADFRYNALFMPHEMIGYDPAIHRANYLLSPETPAGRIMGTALTALASRLPFATVQEGPQMAMDVAELVRALILEGRPRAVSAAVIRARRHAIQSSVDEELSTGAFSVDALCARFAISRASLYRMFADSGGIERYIRQRRLTRCFQELTRSNKERGVVRDVAERWGFHDAANFRRAFRSSFGVTPVEVVGERLDQPLPAPSVDSRVATNLGDWLSHPSITSKRAENELSE